MRGPESRYERRSVARVGPLQFRRISHNTPVLRIPHVVTWPRAPLEALLSVSGRGPIWNIWQGIFVPRPPTLMRYRLPKNCPKTPLSMAAGFLQITRSMGSRRCWLMLTERLPSRIRSAPPFSGDFGFLDQLD
jgi:hypothetical protein